eukprot:comp17163_c1_seq1/m.16005 comp17163_c1_seq1/g.16005  ORF comp17163_c1_seq1/g.16005 comp17163_c1_seq1/m.16005 type:complete len:188 (-) comp17163_c1_seq1:61-624(-)
MVTTAIKYTAATAVLFCAGARASTMAFYNNPECSGSSLYTSNIPLPPHMTTACIPVGNEGTTPVFGLYSQTNNELLIKSGCTNIACKNCETEFRLPAGKCSPVDSKDGADSGSWAIYSPDGKGDWSISIPPIITFPTDTNVANPTATPGEVKNPNESAGSTSTAASPSMVVALAVLIGALAELAVVV